MIYGYPEIIFIKLGRICEIWSVQNYKSISLLNDEVFISAISLHSSRLSTRITIKFSNFFITWLSLSLCICACGAALHKISKMKNIFFVTTNVDILLT